MKKHKFKNKATYEQQAGNSVAAAAGRLVVVARINDPG